MVESFENLDNILHNWAKEKYTKSINVEALNRYEKHSLAGRKMKPFFLENGSKKLLEQLASERNQAKH